MTLHRLILRVACLGFVLGTGCGSVQGDVSPAASVTPTAAATSRPTVGATATSRPQAKPEVKPTAPAQTSGPGLPIDSLPAPEAYYAQLLAREGKDLGACTAAPTPQPGACPKPASLGNSDLKQQINVELILDASGSMAERLGGQPKLEIAKRVLREFIGTLPPKANVALRVYGHKGSSADADKDLSCASSELLYPFQTLDAGRFQSAIQSFQPTGWTPLAASFGGALEDFAQFDPATSSNFVYVVTDGLETCDGDPVASAQTLHAASVQPIVNVVGFDVDPDASEQLRLAAEAGGGKFYEARSADELNKVFKTNFDWAAWSAYYKCRFEAANTQFTDIAAEQNRSYKCASDLINAEYVAVTRDANAELARLSALANDYARAHNGDTTRDQSYAPFMRRVTENYTYAADHEADRYHKVVDARSSQYHDVLDAASAEFHRATQDASDDMHRQPAGP